MGLVLGKSKALIPKNVKEIRAKIAPDKKAHELAFNIAKEFGQQAKKTKSKKIILR